MRSLETATNVVAASYIKTKKQQEKKQADENLLKTSIDLFLVYFPLVWIVKWGKERRLVAGY